MRLTCLLIGLFVLAIGLCAGRALAYSSVSKHLDESPEWYRGEQAKQMAENVLSWQSAEGAWPKNPVDTGAEPYAGKPARIHGTFDNGATTFEMRYLAKMYDATRDERYKASFIKALDHVLDAQYPNGGFPQQHPPGDGYSRYITFNDGAMVRLMFVLRDVFKDDLYAFVGDERRQKCKAAFDRAIDCILKCQIEVDGKKTAWCAQHDEKDFSPRPARTYELVSISGSESIGIVHVLMAVEKPSPEVIAAVDAARDWFESVKIEGIRTEDRPQEGTPRGYDRFVVKDPSAPPMWARFYEIGTNRPLFSDRDGVPKYKLSEIGIERRTGYRWLGTWPKNFLETEYPEWKAAVAAGKPWR